MGGCTSQLHSLVLFLCLFVYNLLEKKTCVIFAKQVDLKVKEVLFKDKIILMKSLSYDIFIMIKEMRYKKFEYTIWKATFSCEQSYFFFFITILYTLKAEQSKNICNKSHQNSVIHSLASNKC